MFQQVNVILLGIDLILIAFIHKELNSLPPLHKTLSTIMRLNMSRMGCYVILAFLLVAGPLVAITVTIMLTKKQVFSEVKSPLASYAIIYNILLLSYLIRVFKQLFAFYTKLALSDTFYFYIRVAKYNNSLLSYLVQYDMTSSLVMHAAVFVGLFLLVELAVIRRLSTTNAGAWSYVKRNWPAILLVVATLVGYGMVIYHIERGVEIHEISLGTSVSMVFSRFYEALLINALLLYIYAVVITNDL
ncbi:hypothetical protein ECANGB1_153 [Enterospora canceri]|uniref:Uncharacterized protein n=1 Tax=Enterospora canceri TaxID=1081671 RepID=A0A1Y1S8D2_9MICR|nr:hypothetical protein ECANGB1_153 [Enterospora canceri]